MYVPVAPLVASSRVDTDLRPAWPEIIETGYPELTGCHHCMIEAEPPETSLPNDLNSTYNSSTSALSDEINE